LTWKALRGLFEIIKKDRDRFYSAGGPRLWLVFLFGFGFSRVFIFISPLLITIISECGANVNKILRDYRDTSIFLENRQYRPVGMGIIGHLGKIFGGALNFFGWKNQL
jgi:hypothetical protein